MSLRTLPVYYKAALANLKVHHARRRPVAIDLFSGCGGLSLGLERAGFEVIGAIDNEPLAVETYRKNHPFVSSWLADIRSIPAAFLFRQLNLVPGQLDLLAGCPPCQGFSTMRTLNGKMSVADRRNGLVIQFLRLARDLRPKAILLENVPGLQDTPWFRKFCDVLRSYGYFVSYNVRNAKDFEVPQRRRRLILMAGLYGEIPFPEKHPRMRTVFDAIGTLDSPSSEPGELHALLESRSQRIKALIEAVPKNGGSRTSLSSQLTCHLDFDGFKDVYGRMSWDKPSPTITSGCINPSKGRFLHPERNSAITLREAAMLQGFPPDYEFSLKRGRYKAADLIGNAMPPDFVRYHARSIRDYLAKRLEVMHHDHRCSFASRADA